MTRDRSSESLHLVTGYKIITTDLTYIASLTQNSTTQPLLQQTNPRRTDKIATFGQGEICSKPLVILRCSIRKSNELPPITGWRIHGQPTSTKRPRNKCKKHVNNGGNSRFVTFLHSEKTHLYTPA